ncbi:MAG: hypothetical protein R3Y13_04535 [bacterium]
MDFLLIFTLQVATVPAALGIKKATINNIVKYFYKKGFKVKKETENMFDDYVKSKNKKEEIICDVLQYLTLLTPCINIVFYTNKFIKKPKEVYNTMIATGVIEPLSVEEQSEYKNIKTIQDKMNYIQKVSFRPIKDVKDVKILMVDNAPMTTDLYTLEDLKELKAIIEQDFVIGNMDESKVAVFVKNSDEDYSHINLYSSEKSELHKFNKITDENDETTEYVVYAQKENVIEENEELEKEIVRTRK